MYRNIFDDWKGLLYVFSGSCEKESQCGIVIDAHMLSVMRRKMLLSANPVLSGFTSDVATGLKSAPKLQNGLLSVSLSDTHFN